jgi:hypothetical protein
MKNRVRACSALSLLLACGGAHAQVVSKPKAVWPVNDPRNWSETAIGVSKFNVDEVLVAAISATGSPTVRAIGYATSFDGAQSFTGHGTISTATGVCNTEDESVDPSIAVSHDGYFWLGGLKKNALETFGLESFFAAQKAPGSALLGAPYVFHCNPSNECRHDFPMLTFGPAANGAPGSALYATFHYDPGPDPAGGTKCPALDQSGNITTYSRPWFYRSQAATPALLGLPSTWGTQQERILKPGETNVQQGQYWGRTVAPAVLHSGLNAGRIVVAMTDAQSYNINTSAHIN